MQYIKRGKVPSRHKLGPLFLAGLGLLILMLSAYSAFSEEPRSPSSSTSSSLEQQPTGAEAPVTVLAQNYERKEKRIFASGNVEVHYKDLKLLADEVEVNTETKDVFAKGNVVLVLTDEVVSGDAIFYNLDSHQGKIEHASGMVQPTIFYRAERIDRKAEGVYGLTQARLTSCTQPTPRWNFSCSRANFKKDDYVEMWNSVFRIKQVPVFYLPYFRYPLGKERSTGFLTPQLGYSGVKGYFFGESFYWAMARNMDATFSLDYYSGKGVGGGLEYRYLFRGGTGGDARIYYFLFKNNPEVKQPENAYLLRLRHNQPLPLGFSLVANIDYQTSFDFLREFDNNIKRATVANLRSEAYISRAWRSINFSLRASRFETIYTDVGNSIITYYRPQVSLNSFKIKLFSPLYFSFDSSFTSWRYGWKSEYEAGTEKYNDVLKFSPTMSLPFSAIPWLTVNSSFTSNFSYYAQSLAPGTSQIINEPLALFDYEFRVDLTGPVFYRIFESSGGETRIKHLVEPFVTFRYESPVSHPERIITSYGFFRTHQVSYGLTNRILVKTDMPREVFAWGVSQTYYLSPEDSPMRYYSWEGKIPDRSDISSYVRFYPAQKYSFDVSAAYNTYSKTFSFLRLGASLNSPADPLFLQVNWLRSINPWVKDILGDRQQVGAVGRLNMPRLNLEVLAEFDYNIQKRQMLYSGLSLVYHYQCLDFKADVRVFYYREKPETQIRFSFGLGNIGKTTDFLGGLGF
jgi:LPS-assembly protein